LNARSDKIINEWNFGDGLLDKPSPCIMSEVILVTEFDNFTAFEIRVKYLKKLYFEPWHSTR